MIIQKRAIFLCISLFILSASGTADVYVETLEDLPLSSSSKNRIVCLSVLSGLIPLIIGTFISIIVEDDDDSAIIAATITATIPASVVGVLCGYEAARKTTPEIQYK